MHRLEVHIVAARLVLATRRRRARGKLCGRHGREWARPHWRSLHRATARTAEESKALPLLGARRLELRARAPAVSTVEIDHGHATAVARRIARGEHPDPLRLLIEDLPAPEVIHLLTVAIPERAILFGVNTCDT